METNQRKVGRPKAPPRTGPLVLGDDCGRTKVTLEVTERAADELAEYTRWVEECSGLTASEAKFKTVDFALRETFRRDRVWQEKQNSSTGAAPPSSPPTPPSPTRSPAALAPRAVAATPPSLPPPAPREPRANP